MATTNSLPNLEALRNTLAEHGYRALSVTLKDTKNDVNPETVRQLTDKTNASSELLQRLEHGVQHASGLFDKMAKELEGMKTETQKYEGWDAQWDETQERLQAQGKELEVKNALVASLEAVLGRNREINTRHDNVLKDPHPFSGEGPDSRTIQATFTHWATCIQLRWAQNPSKFNTETTKLTHIVGLLSGDAWTGQSHVARDILSETGTEFPTGRSFLDHLTHIFAPHDLTQDAKTELLGLLQGDLPFPSFLSKFNALADRARWSDAQKIDGMKTRVSNQIQFMHRNNVDDPPMGDWTAWVERFMKYAAKIEENKALQEHQKAFRGIKKSGNNQNHSNNHSSNHNNHNTMSSINNKSYDPDAMDMDQMTIARLDPTERQRRIDNDLCKRCGRGGHYARNCDGAGNIIPDRYPRLGNNSYTNTGGGRGSRGGGRGGLRPANNYHTGNHQWQAQRNPYQSQQDVQLRTTHVTPLQYPAAQQNHPNQQNQRQGFVYGSVEDLPQAQQREFGFDDQNQGNGNAY